MKRPNRNVLTSRIAGGLGNQLFKLMAGVRIAEDLGLDLIFDISIYSATKEVGHNLSPRGFELNYFPNLLNYKFNNNVPRIYKFKLDRLLKRAPYTVKSKFGYFDDGILSRWDCVTPPKYLDGNFENIQFLPGNPEIAKLLEFPNKKSEWFSHLEKEILNDSIIAIHVRRGDYLNFPEIYDVLSPNYYSEGVKTLLHSLGNSKIWLFSDDLDGAHEWLKGHLPNIRKIETPNSIRPGEVLRLMSLASGIVAAHSTFSWWAGYLGHINGTTKQVVIPDRYFTIESNLENGLAVASWIKLPASS